MNKELECLLKESIRDVPNFPIQGINFKDIMPVFQNPTLCKKVLEELVLEAKKLQPEIIVGLDSRGFLFGSALAFTLGIPFVPIRKKGKLPFKTVSSRYELEYGVSEQEIHIDAFPEGARVLIHDDLLATGGTAACAGKLVAQLKGLVVGYLFLVELNFLEGKSKILPYSSNIISLVSYETE